MDYGRRHSHVGWSEDPGQDRLQVQMEQWSVAQGQKEDADRSGLFLPHFIPLFFLASSSSSSFFLLLVFLLALRILASSPSFLFLFSSCITECPFVYFASMLIG